MDIFTHAGIGLIGAAPFLSSRPELALGFAAGSVLPDLDVLSRLFGKRAFLRSHQTWSHALPLQALLSFAAGWMMQTFAGNGIMLGVGLFAGMSLHSFLDFTNTLGVTLLAPFSRKRVCCEWIFFIDAFFGALTGIMLCLSLTAFFRQTEVPPSYAMIYFMALSFFLAGKAALRQRAGRLAPEALSLMPSALWPWRFLGVTNHGDRVERFRINAITGRRSVINDQVIQADSHVTLLAQIPEFRLMKGLSPAYHVVCVRQIERGKIILCRDLRTRNFDTRFGDLEVLIAPNKPAQVLEFHV